MISSLKSSRFFVFICIFFIFNVFFGVFFPIGIPGYFKIFNNKSSSMSPAINKGDLSIVKVGNNYNYKPGDVIVFYAKIGNKYSIVTHRIVRIGGNVYISKGDNNPNGQEIVVPRLVIGKVTLIIPYFGSYFAFLKTFYGNFILLFIPAIFIILVQIENIRKILKSNN